MSDNTLHERVKSNGIIVSGKAMREVYGVMKHYAQQADTILLVGETGVGKDLIAHEIYRLSGRKDKPFVRVPLSSFSDSLLESELFGYEKGAFTGAESEKTGIFEAADGGVLYFPEISEIPERIQLKLLDFVQYRAFKRVGHNPKHPEINIEVCLIFATNEDPESSVREKKLRSDFYYRINKCRLDIPPLRERIDEIGPLMEHFVKLHGRRMFDKDVGVSTDAIEVLKHYHWPGNVRELEGVLEHALVGNTDLIMNSNDAILLYPGHINSFFPDGNPERKTAFCHFYSGINNLPNYDSAMLESERAYLLELMSRARGNKNKAARIAGFSVKTLRRKLNKFDIMRSS